MRCPVCKEDSLAGSQVANDLKSHSCKKCHGNWVRFDDYDSWKRNSDVFSTSSNVTEEYLPVYDSKQANLCPDCGRILIKYKIHKDINFSLDHCGTCNGVWLDINEWEALIMNKLHHQLYSFFTKPWQNKLRSELTKDRFEKQYINKFGEDDYSKVKNIRDWICNNKNKGELLSYLIDEDPYKI